MSLSRVGIVSSLFLLLYNPTLLSIPHNHNAQAFKPTTPPGNSAASGQSFLMEPLLGKSFVRQVTISSTTDPVPGNSSNQVAVILPPRSDGALYQGSLNYTASKKVDGQVWYSDKIMSCCGGIISPFKFGNTTVTDVGELSSNRSGYNTFNGSALVLHSTEGPFTTTFTVNAVAIHP